MPSVDTIPPWQRTKENSQHHSLAAAMQEKQAGERSPSGLLDKLRRKKINVNFFVESTAQWARNDPELALKRLLSQLKTPEAVMDALFRYEQENGDSLLTPRLAEIYRLAEQAYKQEHNQEYLQRYAISSVMVGAMIGAHEVLAAMDAIFDRSAFLDKTFHLSLAGEGGALQKIVDHLGNNFFAGIFLSGALVGDLVLSMAKKRQEQNTAFFQLLSAIQHLLPYIALSLAAVQNLDADAFQLLITSTGTPDILDIPHGLFGLVEGAVFFQYLKDTHAQSRLSGDRLKHYCNRFAMLISGPTLLLGAGPVSFAEQRMIAGIVDWMGNRLGLIKILKEFWQQYRNT